MKPEMISKTVSPAHGIGNNWGETIIKAYKCPCGKSTVTEEIETTTGFKTVYTAIDCAECATKYYIANNGSRDWTILPIEYGR